MPFIEPNDYLKVTDPEDELIKDQSIFDPRLEIRPKPSLYDIGEAAWDLGNPLANVGELWDQAGEWSQPVNLNYNPFEKNRGTIYENYQEAFLYANNDAQLERIRARIDDDLKNEEVIARSGLLGVGALMTAGLITPGIALIPFGTTARALAKGGSLLSNVASNAGRNALLFGGAVSVDEFLLMNEHYTRTYKDAAKAVGAGALLGGFFGAGGAIIKGTAGEPLNLVATKINRHKTEELLNRITEIPEDGKWSIGDSKFFKDWKDAKIEIDRERIINKIPKLTIGQRTSLSPHETTRKASYSIAEHGINIKGELPNPALETIVNQRVARTFTKLSKALKEGYKEYLDEAGKLNLSNKVKLFFEHGDELDKFGEELVNALTRGDVSEVSQVQKVAQIWRKELDKIAQEMIDNDLIPLKKQAIANAESRVAKLEKEIAKLEKTQKEQKKGLSKRTKATLAKRRTALEESQKELKDVLAKRYTVDDLNLNGTARSWFHRQYNKTKMRQLPKEFEEDVATWVSSSEKISMDDSLKIANEVWDQIINNTPPSFINAVTVTKGAFKGRTLLIPDEVLRPWLINDPLLVMDKWLKNVLSDIEIKKRFGDLDLSSVKKAIKEEVKLREKLNPEQTAALRKQETADIRDLEHMLLRLRGLEGMKYEQGAFHSVLRTIRHWNNARLMGSLALNVFTDIGQLVLTNGFFKTFGGLTKSFTTKALKSSEYKAFTKDMEAMGIGVDAFTNSRRTLFELGTGEPLGNRAEMMAQRFSNFTFKASLMSNIDGFTKRVAGYVASERIYRNVFKGAENLSSKELKWMGNLGIRKEDFTALKNQLKTHSRLEEKFRLYNIDSWTNADAATRFTAALKKIEGTSIITPGIGDAPIIFDNPAFKLLFQYKRFAMAAMQRSLIPALQRTDAGVLAGLTVMFTGGILREISATLLRGGNLNELETPVLIERAIKRADMAGWLPDLYDNAQTVLGNNAYGRSAMDEIMGPSAGWVNNTAKAMQGIKTMLQSETPTKSQIRAIRLCIPMQNLYGINLLLTQAERNINEELGN